MNINRLFNITSSILCAGVVLFTVVASSLAEANGYVDPNYPYAAPNTPEAYDPDLNSMEDVLELANALAEYGIATCYGCVLEGVPEGYAYFGIFRRHPSGAAQIIVTEDAQLNDYGITPVQVFKHEALHAVQWLAMNKKFAQLEPFNIDPDMDLPLSYVLEMVQRGYEERDHHIEYEANSYMRYFSIEDVTILVHYYGTLYMQHLRENPQNPDGLDDF